MKISVTDAKGKLSELVRRAEEGNEVVLTRHGRATVTLVPVRPQLDADSRRGVIAAVRASAAQRRQPCVSAARSQDFLYGDSGLPEWLDDEQRQDEIKAALGTLDDHGHAWDDDPGAWVRAQRRSDSSRSG